MRGAQPDSHHVICNGADYKSRVSSSLTRKEEATQSENRTGKEAVMPKNTQHVQGSITLVGNYRKNFIFKHGVLAVALALSLDVGVHSPYSYAA